MGSEKECRIQHSFLDVGASAALGLGGHSRSWRRHSPSRPSDRLAVGTPPRMAPTSTPPSSNSTSTPSATESCLSISTIAIVSSRCASSKLLGSRSLHGGNADHSSRTPPHRSSSDKSTDTGGPRTHVLLAESARSSRSRALSICGLVPPMIAKTKSSFGWLGSSSLIRTPLVSLRRALAHCIAPPPHIANPAPTPSASSPRTPPPQSINSNRNCPCPICTWSPLRSAARFTVLPFTRTSEP